MKKLLLVACIGLLSLATSAQVKTYNTSGSDFILGYGLLDDTLNPNVVPRLSLWFHYNQTFHFDVAKHFGFFIGYGFSNLGFIAQYNDSLETTKKYRTYNIGVPMGFKFGDFSDNKPMFFFAGAAADVPFHFKEKTFYGKDKHHKYGEWFSQRVNLFQPSFFVGVTLPNKSSIKVQYYFMDFINSGFTDNANGIAFKPYGNLLHSNLITLSYGTSFTGLKKKK